mgnify:CR=1 FL=1
MYNLRNKNGALCIGSLKKCRKVMADFVAGYQKDGFVVETVQKDMTLVSGLYADVLYIKRM